MNNDTAGECRNGKRQLCGKVGRCLYVDGRIKKAVAWLEESCCCVNGLAEDHPNQLALQHMLASVYQANGQVEEAVEMAEHVVRIQEVVLAEDHPDRLALQHVLASAYHANG